VWTTTRLARALQSAGQPVTLLLDIAGTPNLTENLRMLLLRNAFASQVFQLAVVRGILGVGFAGDLERMPLTKMMLSALLKNGPEDALHALRVASSSTIRSSPPQDLFVVLPRLAAALWMHRPDAFYA